MSSNIKTKFWVNEECAVLWNSHSTEAILSLLPIYGKHWSTPVLGWADPILGSEAYYDLVWPSALLSDVEVDGYVPFLVARRKEENDSARS